MPKRIDDSVRKNVIECFKKGMSNLKTVKELKISEPSVRRILIEKNNLRSNNKGGRPEILKKKEKRLIIREFSMGNLETTTNGVELAKGYFDKNVSNSTIRNVLKENDFKSYKKIQKRLISIANLKKRFMNFIKILLIKTFKIMFLQMNLVSNY